jgi:hypothetical protein
MRQPIHEWMHRKPYTTKVAAVLALTLVTGIGEALGGESAKASVAAAFWIFAGLIFGMALGEWKP